MDFIIVSASVLSIAFISIEFVSFCWNRPVAAPLQVTEVSALDAEIAVVTAEVNAYLAADEAIENVVESVSAPAYAAATIAPVAVLTIDPLSTMTTDQLRSECTSRGLRWNRANNGKHLNKQQMIALLR